MGDSSHAFPGDGDGALRSRQTRPDLPALSSAPGRVKPDPLGSLVVALLAVDAGALAVGVLPTVPLMPVQLLHMRLLLLVRPHNRVVRAICLIFGFFTLTLTLFGGFGSLINCRL